MNDFQKCEKCLKLILKKGDLFDVLVKRKNRALLKYPILKANLFFFSRILFLGDLCVEKLFSFFAPVEKVKKAQDQIRESLGIPVDVVRSKKGLATFPYIDIEKTEEGTKVSWFRSKLFLLYENEGMNSNIYIENLKKIYQFCNQHSLSGVLLQKKDILSIAPDIFKNSSFTYVLKHSREILGGNLEEDNYKSAFCEFTSDQLSILIHELKIYQMDKEIIEYFRENITDLVIQKAIEDFLLVGNIERLKEIVRARLTLILNESGSYKDKIYGKVYQNFLVYEKYIQKIVTNKEGKTIEKEILTLYDFLDVKNIEDLFAKLETKMDEPLLYKISAFYVFLCEQPTLFHEKENFRSLYDSFYEGYQKKVKKIPLFYKKSNRFLNFLIRIGHIYWLDVIAIGLGFLLLVGKDFLCNHVFQIKDSHSHEQFLENIEEIREFRVKSFIFEKDLLSSVFSSLKDLLPEVTEKDQTTNLKEENQDSFHLNGTPGDAFEEEEKIWATVNPLDKNVTLPSYFAVSSASSATYEEGKMNYRLHFPNFVVSLYDEEPLFEIRYELSKEDLQTRLFYKDAGFTKTFYPVGDNYVLTGYTITDIEDESKTFIWDLEREQKGLKLTEEEIEILDSMDTPEICYTYGRKDNAKNTFIYDLDKYFYTESSTEEIKNSVRKGLGLDANATVEEIFFAIENKEYSKTPIADAKASLDQLDEKKYYEAIASLDSLVCNLATMLATGVDEDLIYVVGYKNTNDNNITSLEAHAWGMYKTGEIVDVTPYEKVSLVSQIVQKIFEWGKKYHIGYYSVLLLVGLKLKKTYGKKILFVFKKKKVEQVLENPNLANYYAELMKVLYGEETFPVERKPSLFAEAIAKNFYGYTKEELIEIKEILKKNNSCSEEVLKLTKEIPFIVENKEVLKRSLRKKGDGV